MDIALKYRPSNFKDLVGQDVLVHILENAFTLNKIPQAILLSGSSGVGKTTTARIIALCLNCLQGPTFEPCGSCQNCLAIKSSSHPDVMEIDAASHTSIDDIKVILGDICYSPISSKFKVYIIDEVHMLSNSAFNALLKTLEEPPSHVKFILATTETKKIPITVIARCQGFDLHNIPVAKIAERLKEVGQKESYSIENGALELIAQHSGNSMRNALFLMNQAILYSKDKALSIASVTNVLGLTDKDIIFDLLEAILDNDLKKALTIFDKGVNIANPLDIFEDLLQTIQLVCRFLIVKEIDNVNEVDRVKKLSVKKPLIFFSRLWRVILKGIQDIRSSMCSGIAAEMILISLCYLSDLPSPERVVQRVISQNAQKSNRPPSKPAYDQKFLGEGEAQASTVEYSNVFEERSSVSTTKLPSETELRKRSIEFRGRTSESNEEKEAIISNSKQQNYDFERILQLLRQDNQIYLYKQLYDNVELTCCTPGHLKLKALSRLDSNFHNDLRNYLNQATQQEWMITIDANDKVDNLNCACAPEVKNILDIFKGAKVVDIENLE
ncbi:MAG: DNA polymerase III subunit tau [Wolbachia endosymbiont of Ctenocephalides orientis wCori]|nr:MAG: DNA polymerase III subunit tau [Wolbachia endosymbiont of Ctenocephalides orientis wCori]